VSAESAVADDLDLELGKLLDQYEDKLRTVEERRRQVKTDEEIYQKAFADLRIEIIRPVFEAVGAILKARGHDFRISEDEYAGEPGGKTREAAISMQITPSGMGKPLQADGGVPALSFITRRYNKTVCIRSSNGVPRLNGAAGPRGDYQLSQIDKRLVRVELLKLIAGIASR
jgi:hypothetical protein